MKVNENVKKVVAMLALIDDTQAQISRIKAERDDVLRSIKIEFDGKLRQQRTLLQEHNDALASICGPEYDKPKAKTFSGNFDDPTSEAQRLRARAVNYVGEQVLNSTQEVESGQTLSGPDQYARQPDDSTF